LKILFLWVGKNDDREYARGIERYRERIETWARVEERVVRPASERSDAAARREGARILALVNERDRLVALDEGGRTRSRRPSPHGSPRIAIGIRGASCSSSAGHPVLPRKCSPGRRKRCLSRP
jgi:hypothetical protein